MDSLDFFLVDFVDLKTEELEDLRNDDIALGPNIILCTVPIVFIEVSRFSLIKPSILILLQSIDF